MVGCQSDRKDEFKSLRFTQFPIVWQLPDSPDRSPFFFEGVAPKNLEFPSGLELCGASPHAAPAQTSLARRRLFNSMLPACDDDDIDAALSVSRTKLYDRNRRESDPHRYIDSMTLPYVTLPLERLTQRTGLQLGDSIVVINPRTSKLCFALVGDSRDGVVDASLYLAEAIEMRADDEPLYLAFPDTGDGQGVIPSIEQTQARGERLFYRGRLQTWKAILAVRFSDVLNAQQTLVDRTLSTARAQRVLTLA